MNTLRNLSVIICLFCSASISHASEEGALTHYERLLLASCAVLEAASDGADGMQAVLNVIYNRAGGDIHRVVGVVAAPKQFSALNSATSARHPDYGPIIERATSDASFSLAFDLVRRLELGELPDITGGADHYHLDRGKAPYWARSMDQTTRIGEHIFYRSTNAEPALVALSE